MFEKDKEEMSLQENIVNLSFLGSGYPLYFNFIKYCVFIFLILLLTSGDFNLITNWMGKDCKDYGDDTKVSYYECKKDFIS